MEDADFVYHGSYKLFDADHAIPRRNSRSRWDEKTQSYVKIFDQESFHATPYRWIALAYTADTSAPYVIDGEQAHYNMGVSLYENKKQIEILGFGSLEESMNILYGKGGYLYVFNRSDFIHKEGLGTLELIIEQPTKPLRVERIDDPIAELRKEGIDFVFIDLALPENKQWRNVY